MNSTASRQLAVVSSACLLLIPQASAHAVGLREEAVSYRQEGFERQRQGDLDGAIAAYQKATALDPSYAAPRNDLGVLYEQQGKVQQARQAYEEALAVDPKYLGAHANLALLYERVGEKEKAAFQWLKRYELGEANDPWTIRAEERLTALGILQSSPGLKGKIFTARRVVEQEFEAHEQSLNEFHAVTERW